ncbi:MAG: hypothetical protein UIB61_00480 [Treponema sp.]|nr:hypothetical protein [Treponema sp.]
MRKFLILACIAMFFSVGAFAKETAQNLDFSIPVDTRELDFSSDDFPKDLNEKSTSFDFDYSMMTINESGFSFIFGANVGYTSTKLDGFDDLTGLDLGIKLGWGGLPVNTNNFLLGFHGFFGFGFRSLKLNESSVDYKFSLFNIKLGADVVAIYRFSDNVGINAGVDLFTNLPAVGTLYADTSSDDHGYGFSCMGGIGVVPKVGVTLFF